MSRVSTIIRVYNVESCLGGCRNSILRQTLSDIEALYVDDGPTDSCIRIAANCAVRDSLVKALSAPHGVSCRPRAAGVSANALKDLVCNKVMSDADLFRRSVAAGCYFPGPPMRITRKAIIDAKNCGFPEAPFHGDNYFTTVSLYNSARTMALSHKYYRRRVRTDSITTSVGTEKIHYASTINVLKALLEFPPLQQDVLNGNRAVQLYLTKIASTLVRRGRTLDRDAMRELFEKTSDGCGAAVFILLNAVCRPALLALNERPYSVRGCLKYAFGRMLGLRRRLRDYLSE